MEKGKIKLVPRFTDFSVKSLKIGVITFAIATGIAATGFVVTNTGHVYAAETELSPTGDYTRVAPATVNVTLHKGMTEQSDADPTDSNISASVTKNGKQGSITADGETQAWNGDTVDYDPAKYGKVGFTAYDITSEVKDTTNAGIKAVGDSIAKSQAAGTLGTNEYIKGAKTKTAEQFITSGSTTTFKGLAASDDTSDHHIWVFVETTHSKGLVTQVSQPVVASLPLTNKTGTSFQTTSNFYPKNIVKKLKFTLIKHGDSPSGDGKTSLMAGVEFQLYSGKPGSGTKTGTAVKTDAKGQLTVSGLTRGDYYFVENPSANVADIDSDDTQTYLQGANYRNDTANKLTFSIGEDGIDPTSLHADAMNYHAPNMTKVLDASDTNFDSSFTEGTLATFTTQIDTPNDIKGGSGSEIGGQSYVTEPYGVFNYTDTADPALTWVRSEGDLKMTEPDGTVLKEGTDYTLTDLADGRGYKIEFIQKDGQVSDTVAKFQGKKINLDYKMVINNNAVIDSAIYNTGDLAYQNHPTNVGTQKIRHIIHKVPVYTYGAKFVKKSTGVFGSGIADTELEGAQYVVMNSDGKYFNGFKDGNDADDVKEAQWVDKLDQVTSAGKLTSGKDGTFEIKGLHKGTYVLHEIVAPDGYELNKKDLKFDVGDKTYTNTVYTARDDQKPGLPDTGSNEGKLLYTVGFLVLASAATGAVYVAVKKRKEMAA